MSGQATLTYRTPEGREERVTLDPGRETSIGRHPACTITVAQASVSRKHARIFFEAGGYYVEDLNSSNGTYVNDQRISKVSLAEGDRLRCGDFELNYDVGAPGVPLPTPASEPPRLSLVGKLKPGARLSSGSGAVKGEPSGRPTPAPLPSGRGAKPLPLPTGRGGAAPAGRGSLPTGRGPRISEPSVGGGGNDAEELARLREEVAHWKAQAEANGLLPKTDPKEVEELREQLDRAKQLVNDQEIDIEDKARRIRELESENLRNEEQLQTVTDRSLRLKEETQRLKQQLEEYRVEKNDLEYGLAEAKRALEQLQANQETAGQTEARLAGEINDLKRQVRERDNRIREVQQELQVVEHDRDAFRKQNEDLQLALDHDEKQRRQLTTQLADLRQVLDHKEEEIDRLSAEVSRLEALVGEQRDGSAALAQLQLAVETANAAKAEARAALSDAERRAGELQVALDEAVSRAHRAEAAAEQARGQQERAGATSRETIEELNELKRANRDLRHALEEAGNAAPASDGARLLELEAEVEGLQADLALARSMARDAESRVLAAEERARSNAPAPASPAPNEGPTRVGPVPAEATAGDYAGLRSATVGLYEQLNDMASDILDKARSATAYAADLKNIRLVVEALPLGELPPATAEKVRQDIEGADLDFVLEDTLRALQGTEDGAQGFKDAMRMFRRTLRDHGYGS